MFNLISVHKPVNALKLLAAGIVPSLLAVQLSPLNLQQFNQSTTRLSTSGFITNQTNQSQSQNNNSPLILAALVAGGIVAGVALQNKGNGQGSNTGSSSFGGQQSSVVTLDQTSRKLQKRLINLLHDDRQAATRLLTQAKFKYPNKTVDWYAEKVIYDLERDRGGR